MQKTTLTISDEMAEVLRDLRPFFGTTDDAETIGKALAMAKVAADHSLLIDGKRCVIILRTVDDPLAVVLDSRD